MVQPRETRSRRPWTRALAVVAAALLGAPGPSAWPAHAEDGASGPSRGRRVQTVSEAFNRRLQAASDLLADDKVEEAREVADALARRRGLNDYERALVWQLQAFVEYALGNTEAAIAAFEKCLAQDALPPATQRDLQLDLGQLYLATGRTDEAVATLEDWLSQVESPSAEAEYLLGSAHARKEDWKKAASHAARAVAMTEKPRQSWLQLLLACRVANGELRESIGVLQRLITLYPKKTWWTQLASIYAELGEGEKSLATLELAYRQGLLDRPAELVNLARLYLHFDVPVKAARVLERAVDEGVLAPDAENLELLGNAWMAAREFDAALGPLSRAAELSDEGAVYFRLGQIHAEREEWEQARESLEKALAKGGLDDPANALLLSGVASYHSDRPAAARRAFERASGFEATREQATSWLRYMAGDDERT